MRHLLLISAALLSGCHGTTAYLGGGKLWQDQSYSYSGGCGPRASGELDDSYFAGAALAIQLTPEAVVQVAQAPDVTSLERVYPYEGVPGEHETLLATLRQTVSTLSDRVETVATEAQSLSERTEGLAADSLGYDDLARLGGLGGAIGGLGWGGTALYRRRRRAQD